MAGIQFGWSRKVSEDMTFGLRLGGMGDGLGLAVGRKDPSAYSMLSESENPGTKAEDAGRWPGRPCRPGYETHILFSAFLITNSERR